jgi:hypothetical protein
MSAKEWKRRMNKAYQAASNGRPEDLDSLCKEIETMESELEAFKKPKPQPKREYIRTVNPDA